jgi:tetratricopeptide (TPR) repeat protein
MAEDYHQIKEGISNVTEDIKLNPNDDTLYHSRAQGYYMIGQFDKAIADHTKAIGLNPRVAGYYICRAFLYRWFKGQYDKAIADYTKAIDLNLIGEHDKAIVDDYKDLGFSARAAKNFILRRNTFAYKNRGDAYASDGQYDKAIADYDRAIELDPGFAAAYYRKAWILATCRDATYRDGATALELAKEAVWLDPRAAFYDSLAAAYAEVGRFEDAIKTQEKFIDLLQKEGKAKNLIDQERLESYKAHKPWREKYVW